MHAGGMLYTIWLMLSVTTVVFRSEQITVKDGGKDGVSLMFYTELLTEGELRNIHAVYGVTPQISTLEVGDKFTPYMNERIEHLQMVHNSLNSSSEKHFLNGVMVLALRQVAGLNSAEQVGQTILSTYQGLGLSDCQGLNTRFHFDKIFGNCTGH